MWKVGVGVVLVEDPFWSLVNSGCIPERQPFIKVHHWWQILDRTVGNVSSWLACVTGDWRYLRVLSSTFGYFIYVEVYTSLYYTSMILHYWSIHNTTFYFILFSRFISRSFRLIYCNRICPFFCSQYVWNFTRFEIIRKIVSDHGELLVPVFYRSRKNTP